MAVAGYEYSGLSENLDRLGQEFLNEGKNGPVVMNKIEASYLFSSKKKEI